MPVDRAHLGRRYGPFAFAVGREHVRDFVTAIGGGVPGHALSAPPDHAHPLTFDDDAARAGPHGGIVAPPGFAAAFAMEPFARAVGDPALGLDLLRLVHGEQELELLEPVRPGDLLSTSGEITRLDERGNLDVVEVTTTTVNQHGRTVVRGVWTAVVRH
ncbi:MAG TPA: MaoC family dehydratase N-terminal domain-containing protein [Anaeromyxobacter sp.]